MDKKMKEYLEQAYEPPKPLHKQEFLQQISVRSREWEKSVIQKQSISRTSFFWQQAGYIRKTVWFASAIFFVGAWFIGRTVEKDSVWAVAALIPFLAFVMITETMKAVTCHMEELEMSARYSMKDVVVARLVILGVMNFLLMLCLIPFLAKQNILTGWETGLALFVPYLLTATLELWAIRKVRGREAVYFCMGIAVCVSGLQLMLQSVDVVLYSGNTVQMCVAAGILLAGFARECRCVIKQTEEYVWN